MSEIVSIKSISEVHRIFGLEKPHHPLVSVLPIDDRMTNFDYRNVRYVFDFYQISLKQGFSGSMRYGRNTYDFEEGTLTFIKPHQSIQVENQEEIKGSSGWTLLFHPDLIRTSNLGKTMEAFSFFDYDQHEALHLSDKERMIVTELVQKVKEEYQQNIDKHSQELIVANIELLLKYSERFYDQQFYTRTNLNKDFLSKFNRFLKDYYRSEAPMSEGVLTVRHCADHLHLSVNYLGDLLKAETGRSAKEHIQDYVVEHAKTQLLGTREDVSQIAYQLGYEYPQGFNKLFKARVGLSPSQYRKLN
ncbi:MAG: helix-turn-helix domain-containing protein [Salibacteraceae bacterium]